MELAKAMVEVPVKLQINSGQQAAEVSVAKPAVELQRIEQESAEKPVVEPQRSEPQVLEQPENVQLKGGDSHGSI
jgi:hypothetical protein